MAEKRERCGECGRLLPEWVGPSPAQTDNLALFAYRAGHKAGLAGRPVTSNDRAQGTIFCDAWVDGWNDAVESKGVASGG